MEEYKGIYRLYTVEDYLNYVKTRLGGTDLEIELTEEDIRVCISDGLLLLNIYRSDYAPRKTTLIQTTGDTEYTLPSEAVRIVDVTGLPTGHGDAYKPMLQPSGLIVKKLMGEMLALGNQFLGTTIATYFSYYQEIAKLMFGVSTWIVNGRRLRIIPAPASGLDLQIEYVEAYTLESLHDNLFNEGWMRKWVYESAVEILNRKRNTLGNNLPIVDGSIQLEVVEHLTSLQDLITEIEENNHIHPAAVMGGVF